MICAATVAALGGCAMGREAGAGDPFLGEAVKYNAAVQTINPDPVYTADMAKPGDNGEKGAAAVKRYRTDQVKPIETIQTTAGTTDSSSGSTPPR
jgi:hypothetical protein